MLQRSITILLAVAIFLVLGVSWQVTQLARKLSDYAIIPIQENTMSTSWKSGGFLWTTTTTREPGETDAHLIRRHFDQVAADLVAHPIDH